MSSGVGNKCRMAWLLAMAAVPLACGGRPQELSAPERTNGAVTGTITISGRLATSDGTAIVGASVTLAGTSQAVQTTNANGQYAFSSLNAGSYSVQPTKGGCSFNPTVANLNNLSSSRTQSFFGSGAGCLAPVPNFVPFDDASIVLTARRVYADSTWKDAETTLPNPQRMTIPATLPVTLGNGGDGLVVLSYRTAAGEVRCEYRGGASSAHPTTPVQIAEGQEYKLSSCWDGAQPGAERIVTWVKLHVETGDAADAAQMTEVRARLGGPGSRVLAPPVTRAQSVAHRDGFSWRNTQALPETNSEGQPSIWYAMIYVESKEDSQALRWLYIHHDTLPLFNSELAQWQGSRGIFMNDGDGTGQFVFAVIHGATYNQIRQAALAGDEVFRAVVLRQPPAEARNPDGSLSYAALAANAFVYEADLTIQVPDDDQPAAKVASSAAPNVRRFGLRQLIRGIARAVVGIVNATQRFYGAIDRWVNGSINLTVALDVRNTDSGFGGPIVDENGNDTSTPFQRAWGSSRGSQAKLPDVRVEVRTLAPLGTAALFVEHTGSDGTAKIKVSKSRKAIVCIDTENKSALVTNWLFPIKICDFGTYGAGLPDTDTTDNWRVRNKYANVLMQTSEGRAYLTEIVGMPPVKADVMVGSLADALGHFNNAAAFAPCFGFPNSTFDDIVRRLTGALSLIPVVGQVLATTVQVATTIYGSTDIFLPEGDDHGDRNLSSRGIVTHEYGHFAICSLISAISPYEISTAYTGAMIQQIMAAGAPTPPPTAQGAYLNDSFADFFAAQVAGGVNYFNPGNSKRVNNVAYCSAATPCLDSFYPVSRDTYNEQVERVVSTLHDAFDGHTPGSNAPGNADVWDISTSQLFYADQHFGDFEDDDVTLPGSGFFEMLLHWRSHAELFTEKSVYQGLVDTMTRAGYSWCEQCRLFAHNEPTFGPWALDREMFDGCGVAPMSGWMGAAPDHTDPTSCTYAAYFKGCRGGRMCDEIVDPVYFSNHPYCQRHDTCLGQYGGCGSLCPVPTAEEVPNITVKAAGEVTTTARIMVGYHWSNGDTGGFASAAVSNQPWAELGFGVGVHAPLDALAGIECQPNATDRRVSSIDVRWKSGSTQSLPCSGGSAEPCWKDVQVNGGFAATCTFAVSP